MPTASPLGLRKSFGFGDRLGLATPGHLAAVRRFPDFAPNFAQQSIREMTRTQRTPDEVMRAAQTALDRAGFTGLWGADGDHLKTPEDVRLVAAAGFRFFTIDPSAFVNNAADHLDETALHAEVAKLEADGVFAGFDWRGQYLGQEFEIGDGAPLQFTHETLFRAAVKYARATAHCAVMGQAIAAANADRGFDVEVSVDETDSPTSPLEHLFFALELRRRGVPNVVSLAPRFIGEFEKGIDYKGDLVAFEAQLRQHAAIAKFYGPYKISVHSGSDKFSAYPVVGRVCGDLLHVKTAGTSYLEALRVVARTNVPLFAEIAAYARGRFETDRASYHISATNADVAALPAYRGTGDEAVYLDEVAGRQLLHVTFGSVLTVGVDSQGRRFKDGLLEALHRHADLHSELLEKHFVKHLSLLNAG
jgi:tagaturonate epimerase